MLKYLQKFQESEKEHAFYIITFEQPGYAMSKDLINSTQNKLKSDYQIYWTPFTYHRGGRLILFKKLWDLLLVIAAAFNIKRKKSLHRIIGFTSISGTLSYITSKILSVPLVLLNIEPHSDYMVDFGYWSKSSFSYKLLKFLEKKQMEHSLFLAVPTQNAYDLLKNEPNIEKHLYFVPTCIKVEDFSFNEKSRKLIREKIGVDDFTKVLVYIGKFDGIYYSADQMAETFNNMNPDINRLFFYIITSDDHDEIKQAFNKFNLEGKYYIQKRIQYEEISSHLSAGDLGVLLIPSFPSQLFRCPIKTANYLACGLPYLITNNIGDDSHLAEKLDLGIILNQENNQSIYNILNDKSFDRKRLQKAVHKHRNIRHIINYFKMSLS